MTEEDNLLLAKYEIPKAGGKEDKANTPKVQHPWLRRTEYTSSTIHRSQGRDMVEG